LLDFSEKFYLFSAALHAGANHALLWLVALGLVGSFVSLYYYLLVLKAIFVDTPSLAVMEPMEAHAIRFFAGSYGCSACRSSCFARVMPNVLASRILAAIRKKFQKMQLTLDPRT